jgi:hypothetical protein
MGETLVTLSAAASGSWPVAGDRQFDPGQPAYLRLPPDRVLLFTATGQRIYDSEVELSWPTIWSDIP